MTIAKTATAIAALIALTLTVAWLAYGYRSYRNVEEFDSDMGDCVMCPDVGRPRVYWPYSLITGPDPRDERRNR